MKISIIVAAHKPFTLKLDNSYLALQVGAAGRERLGLVTDDTGENISEKNPSFCELTGLYWAWKNLTDADIIGLVHYRRFFKGKHGLIATGDEIAEKLGKYDCILPKKRNYFIETAYSHYAHAHNIVDLETTRAIIAEKHPAYLAAFDKAMKSTRGHRFNMMVMKRQLIDDYCTWLFDILFELEKRLDISTYSAYDRRVFGFVAERILDVYIDTKKVKYAELPVLNLEPQHWPKKIMRFLKRKFTARR